MFGDDVIGPSPMDGVLARPPRRLSHDHSLCGVLATRLRPGFSTEAIHTAARVNVTCVTPLGEELASTS
jgi:hypothetical protein